MGYIFRDHMKKDLIMNKLFDEQNNNKKRPVLGSPWPGGVSHISHWVLVTFTLRLKTECFGWLTRLVKKGLQGGQPLRPGREVSRRHLLPRERASESQGWRARA